MKKILAIFMCGALLMGFTACGQKTTEKTVSTDSPEGAQEESGASADLKEVNVVLDWYPNAVHAFIYDAIEKATMRKRELK